MPCRSARRSERESGTMSGIILAMETSGDFCSTAVLRDGTILAERAFHHDMHLSERMMEHIESVLNDSGTTLDEVESFAAGIGPGSFTGTRIGLMTLKALAVVKAKPIYGAGSLETMAAEYLGLQDTLIAPILPCRSGVVYAALFDVSGFSPIIKMTPCSVRLENLADALAAGSNGSRILLCGTASESCYSALCKDMPPGTSLSCGRVMHPRAEMTGFLAHQRRDSGDPGENADIIAPAYLAPPPITLPKNAVMEKEKAVENNV